MSIHQAFRRNISSNHPFKEILGIPQVLFKYIITLKTVFLYDENLMRYGLAVLSKFSSQFISRQKSDFNSVRSHICTLHQQQTKEIGF